jgi:hypothetical protein
MLLIASSNLITKEWLHSLARRKLGEESSVKRSIIFELVARASPSWYGATLLMILNNAGYTASRRPLGVVKMVCIDCAAISISAMCATKLGDTHAY